MSEQDTAERIQREIGNYYGHGPAAPKESPLSRMIAAEIDALTRERDEARAMIDTLKPSWMGDNPRPETLVETCQRLAAEVNTLTAQRDEARAELVARSSQLIVRKAELVECEGKLAERDAYREGYNRLTAQLAEARAETQRVIAANEDERQGDADVIAGLKAEIERLRLSADAWESCVATAREIWTFGHERGGERQMLQHVEYLLGEIDARARAAKEAKP